MVSKYSISDNITEFASDFARITDANSQFDLIDVKYADGIWLATYGDNIGKAGGITSDTTWSFEPTIEDFQATVAEQKEDGFELTDVEYTDGGYWFGIFANYTGDSELIVAEDNSEFNEQLMELQDLDSDFVFEYQVLDLESTDGLWIGVAKRTYGSVAYTFSEDFSEFEAEVEQQQEDGLELTNIEYIEEGWHSIFSNDVLSGNYLFGSSTYSPQPHADLDDFTAEIREFRTEGFDLVNIESIDGDWFGIYRENTDRTDDIITPSDALDPAENVEIERQRVPSSIDF